MQWLTLKSKQREKKSKKMNISAKTYIFLLYMPSKNKGDIMKIKMLSCKLKFDRKIMSYTMFEDRRRTHACLCYPNLQLFFLD
jgi:hypothetical protein